MQYETGADCLHVGVYTIPYRQPQEILGRAQSIGRNKPSDVTSRRYKASAIFATWAISLTSCTRTISAPPRMEAVTAAAVAVAAAAAVVVVAFAATKD